MLEQNPCVKRPLGWPRTIWESIIKKDVELLGDDCPIWKEKATNREGLMKIWNGIVLRPEEKKPLSHNMHISIYSKNRTGASKKNSGPGTKTSPHDSIIYRYINILSDPDLGDTHPLLGPCRQN